MPLSGAFWVGQFPGSRSIADLELDFGQRVQRFLNAISSARAGLPDARAANARSGAPNFAGPVVVGAPAGAVAQAGPAQRVQHPHVQINATFRPAQRAYMMHYSWLITRNQIDPVHVPAYQPIGNQQTPVDIQWVHRDRSGRPDIAASMRAALEMVNGFQIANLHVAPALDSNHVHGRAIDMTISWVGNMEIVDNLNQTVLINTLPRNGTNRRLIELGATYQVYHLRHVSADPPHWSYNGH